MAPKMHHQVSAIPTQLAIHESKQSTKKTGGIAKAQNTGLDIAHGDYIAFADNDDILDRHNIEYLLHALQITGADMSKARWQQFGVSQLENISHQALQGTVGTENDKCFQQSVACLSNGIQQNSPIDRRIYRT